MRWVRAHELERRTLGAGAVEPIITIVTLMHPHRPVLQSRNIEAVRKCRDVEHLRVELVVESNPEAAHETIADPELAALIGGRYVWVIDDDDMLVDAMVPVIVRQHAMSTGRFPEWFMVQAHLGEPYDGMWPVYEVRRPVDFKRPQGWSPGDTPGRVSMLNLIVRRDVWCRHQHVMRERPGDWHLTCAMWAEGLRPVWLEGLVGARTQIAHMRGGREPTNVLTVSTAPGANP